MTLGAKGLVGKSATDRHTNPQIFFKNNIKTCKASNLGENKFVYVFSAEMSGFSTNNVRDPRSQDPAF